MAKKVAVGIDLGTSYSCVAVWMNGGVVIIENDQGFRTTPSYVAFSDTERLIGNVAENLACRNPENTVFDSKRLIGRKFSDPFVQEQIKTWPFRVEAGADDKPMIVVQLRGEERKFHPEEISAMVLLKMKETAEDYLGTKIRDAVVSVPAHFTYSQRQATKDAATISGINVLRLINEPTAAAIAYGLDKRIRREQNVLIFDMGGGTLDVSLLGIEDTVFQVKATAGNAHLGGENLLNRIVDFCKLDFKRKNRGKDLADSSRAVQRLRAQCERAKCTLSSNTQATIEIDSLLRGIDYSCTLTRAWFEELNMDHFRNSLGPVEKCLRDSGVDKSSVDKVVLVGGSTRIPMVKQLIQEFFDGKELCTSINPDEAVAFGAAVMAAILTGESSTPVDQCLIMDIFPLSLGIRTAGGVMTKLMERNTTIPTTRGRRFAASNFPPGDKGMLIQVFEGERDLVKDNNLLGSLLLDGIPIASQGDDLIEVYVDLCANEVIRVQAKDTSTGKFAKWSPEVRLSQVELIRMVQVAETLRFEDEANKSKMKARNCLENYCFAMRNALAEEKLCEKLSSGDKEEIERAVQETFDWLEKNQLAEKDEFDAKQEELKSFVDHIMMKAGPHASCRQGRGPEARQKEREEQRQLDAETLEVVCDQSVMISSLTGLLQKHTQAGSTSGSGAAEEVPVFQLQQDAKELQEALAMAGLSAVSADDAPRLEEALASVETYQRKSADAVSIFRQHILQSASRLDLHGPPGSDLQCVTESIRSLSSHIEEFQMAANQMREHAAVVQAQAVHALQPVLTRLQTTIAQRLCQQLQDKSWRLQGNKLQRQLDRLRLDLLHKEAEIRDSEDQAELQQLRKDAAKLKEDIDKVRVERRALDYRFQQLAQQAMEVATDPSDVQKVTDQLFHAAEAVLGGRFRELAADALQGTGARMEPLARLVQCRTLEDYDEDSEGISPSRSILFRKHGGRRVALKKVQLDTANMRGFAYVVGIHATLKHPNLLPLQSLFFVKDEIHGLFSYMEMERRPFTLETWPVGSVKDVGRALRDMSNVVDFLHKKDVKHGDLKPTNFLVSDDGLVQLIDLELARSKREQGDTSIVAALSVGHSPGYTAPELLREDGTRDLEKELTKEADIFSLGKTFKAFLHRGEVLLGDAADLRHPQEFAAAMCRLDPALRPSAPEVLRAVCHLDSTDLDTQLVQQPRHWSSPDAGGPWKLVLCENVEPFKELLTVHGALGGADWQCPGSYSRLELVGAWRVENRSLWEKFAAERKSLRATNRSLQTMGIPQPAVNLKVPLHGAMQMLHTDGHSEPFDRSVGEVLLLHGTKHRIAPRIIGEGFNQQLAGTGAGTMFGNGIYMAEEVEKVDQYTTPGILPESWPLPAGGSREDTFLVVVCRALMGHYLLTTKDHVCQASGTPLFVKAQLRPHPDRPGHHWDFGPRRELRLLDPPPGVDLRRWAERPHYHSLIAELGGWIHRYREFIVFHGERIYPEYIIAYRRAA